LVTDSNKDTVAHFSNRRGLIEVENSTTRSWKASQAGLDLNPQDLVESEQIGELTPDILQGESWREMEFKAFDIHAPAPIPLGGRPHPLQSLIDRIRAVFLEMGFSEITGNYVQSAGWNMDALFIPQDHPARTMQDTFYLAEPEIVGIDDKHLRQWAEVHESGGSTVSRGWGGSFDVNESRKALLRTHTTVNTVRHIADHPSKPSRVFGVGRVFRQETIDRTHLPEFHQIEGIIHEEKASLPMLITTLRTFYSKMGYSDVRVRPAYFPYTEPSIEVEILWRGKWLELGGAGIFRPEVTQPLGTGWPVCAWGMGLERLAMLILGLDDIRELYQPDLEVLSKMPLL
jgi:phenylalanyl-tRNA synthetase alpha chain